MKKINEIGKLEISVEMLKNLCLLYDVGADYILGLKDVSRQRMPFFIAFA